jgi:PhnB protein
MIHQCPTDNATVRQFASSRNQLCKRAKIAPDPIWEQEISMAKAIPEGYHTITPALTVKNCAKALDFYKTAFGAEELFRMTSPDGKIGHAEIKIGDSIIFLSDEFDMPGCAKSPQTLGASTGGLCIYVPDVDASYDRAVKAGASPNMPVSDMFWGDRYGNLIDPFGHVWAIATHKEDLTPQQIDERAQEFYAKMSKGSAA